MVNKIGYKDAARIIEKEYPDSLIKCAMKAKDGFIFALRPKDWDSSKEILDPFFKVDDAGKISEYSPVMDPEEFKMAMRNIVYRDKAK